MRIGNFNLMSYRHLPSDFSKTNESVWVNFDTKLLDPVLLCQDFSDTLDEHEYAASVGFDMLGMNEHHGNGYGLMPSPNLMAAALARRTRDAMLLVLGNSLALYNPPQRVAEEFAMLDCISGGRVIAGFPVGTPMDTCYVYGTNSSELRDRYYEAHDLIIAAWKNKEPFSFKGRFNQQRYVNITPRPVQDPHPPIWIPAGGSVETWRFCALHDYVYCYLTYFGYLSGEKIIKGYWDEMKDAGKPPNPFQAGIVQFVGVADSFDEALKLYSEPATYFFNNILHVNPRWTVAPGYITEATARAGIASQVQAAANRSVASQAQADTRHLEFREMVEKGFVIIGEPDQVAEKLRHVATSQNVGNILAMAQFGNMNSELARYNMKRIAQEVKPQIQDIFRKRMGTSQLAQAGKLRTPPSRSPMNPITETIVEVAGGPCRVWEKGHGEPLGVLFGLGGCPRWSPFLELLAERRKVIVPSLPGFQGSGTQYRTLDGHLDWITATLDLLEAAELTGADIVGSSVAGMLCAEVAALVPAFVRRLVLCDSYGIFDVQDPGGDVFALMPDDSVALQTNDLDKYKELFDARDEDEQVEWKISLFRANEAAARIIWPFGDRGLEKRLHRVRVPTLLLWGANDRVVPPSYMKRFAAHIAGPVKTKVIANAGHLSWLDQPKRSADAILNFLSSE